jgi:hypothetical protein
MRDRLISLFEREFIETQEACGMVPIGHYRDLDEPNSFVWFRGFENMETRRAALEAFYMRSDAWLTHRDEANDTMLDSDDVLLLRNARPSSGFDLYGLARDTNTVANSLVAASIHMLEQPASESFIASLEERLLPKLRRHGERIACFVTEDAANTFPRLPVREGEWAVVVVGSCTDDDALQKWEDALGARWETLRLAPASRSLFR